MKSNRLSLSFLLVFTSAVAVASDDPIHDAFEEYKNCVKLEYSKKSKINANNFQKFCKAELSQVQALMGTNKGKTLKIVKKWLKNLDDDKKG